MVKSIRDLSSVTVIGLDIAKNGFGWLANP
jgi:hypothetical protein